MIFPHALVVRFFWLRTFPKALSWGRKIHEVDLCTTSWKITSQVRTRKLHCNICRSLPSYFLAAVQISCCLRGISWRPLNCYSYNYHQPLLVHCKTKDFPNFIRMLHKWIYQHDAAKVNHKWMNMAAFVARCIAFSFFSLIFNQSSSLSLYTTKRHWNKTNCNVVTTEITTH